MRFIICFVLLFWQGLGFSQIVKIPQESFLTENDPNFDPDFDWTLNEPYDLFVQTSTGLVHHQNVRLPYFSNEGPSAADFNSDLPGVRDILPEDGWVLLFKDFGTSTRGVSFPRLMLYNRFRGLLRLFYFNGHFPEVFTYGIVSLRKQDASKPFGLFTFADERKTTLEDFDPDRTEIFIGKLQPLVWNYADFIVAGFEPNLPDDAKFLFQITGVRSSDVELTGSITLDQVLENSNIGLSRSNPLGRILDIGRGVINSYKSAGDAVGGLKKLVDKKKGAHKDAFFANFLRGILDDPFVTHVVPGISVAAAFFKMFSGGNSPAQVQPLKFQGELSLTGKITLEGDIQSFLLRVPGANHLARDNLPFYDKPIGVFNLRRKPGIAVKTVLETRACRNIEKREKPTRITGERDFPRGRKPDVRVGPKILRLPVPTKHLHQLDRPQVIINPDAGINAKIEAAFIKPNSLPDFFRNVESDGFFNISRIPVLTDKLKKPAQCDDAAPKVKRRNVAIRLTIVPEDAPDDFTPITLVKLYPSVYRSSGTEFTNK